MYESSVIIIITYNICLTASNLYCLYMCGYRVDYLGMGNRSGSLPLKKMDFSSTSCSSSNRGEILRASPSIQGGRCGMVWLSVGLIQATVFLRVHLSRTRKDFPFLAIQSKGTNRMNGE